MITFNTLIGFMINVDRRQKGKCEKHDNTTDVCKTHLLQPVVYSATNISAIRYLVSFWQLPLYFRWTHQVGIFSSWRFAKSIKVGRWHDMVTPWCPSTRTVRFHWWVHILQIKIINSNNSTPQATLSKNKSLEDILFIYTKQLWLQRNCQVFS